MSSTPVTPPAAACLLETPDWRLGTNQSRPHPHSNAEGEYSDLMGMRPGRDVAARTTDHNQQESTDLNMHHSSNPSIKQLSNVLAASTLDEPQLSKDKSGKEKSRLKRRVKQLRREEAFAPISFEGRAKKQVKRKAKTLRKQQKKQKKSKKVFSRHLDPRPSREHCLRLSQILLADIALLEQDAEPQDDADEGEFDTSSMDVQYSPGETWTCDAVHVRRKATGRDREVQDILVMKRTVFPTGVFQEDGKNTFERVIE